jgi:hypothetical protein
VTIFVRSIAFIIQTEAVSFRTGHWTIEADATAFSSISSMEIVGMIIWRGTFPELRLLIDELGMVGAWRVGDQCQYRTDRGIFVNFWPSTGTVNFQGPQGAASSLREEFLARAGEKAVVRSKGRP